MILTLGWVAKVKKLLRGVATRRARCVAFAMGRQERLGSSVWLKALDPEVVRMILVAGVPRS